MTGRMFCDCQSCVEKSKLFSKALSDSMVQKQRVERWLDETERRRSEMSQCMACDLVCDGVFAPSAGLDVDSSVLLSSVSERVILHRVNESTFLNDDSDTLSKSAHLERYFQVLFPLLSEISVNEDDGSWWLLDSGASTTVMSSRFLNLYAATSE